jgi:hypothetical protein
VDVVSGPPPREVEEAIVALARAGTTITAELRPWQAWQVVLVCQHLAANPHESDVLPQALNDVGRALQAAIVAVAPEAAAYLEAGWSRKE